METILPNYSTSAIICLAVTSLLWGGSHIFLVMGSRELDFLSRIFGFIGVISQFFISGLKDGLLSLPIVFVFSCMGTWEAKKLREKLEKNNKKL